jgi:hypothetical protein
MDLDFGVEHGFGLLKNFYPTTPREKLGVASYISNQAIHPVSGLAN